MVDEKPVIPRVIHCPRCRKSTRYDATNEFRPFCSARCKNEDIVDWAEQKMGIPGALQETDDFLIDKSDESDD